MKRTSKQIKVGNAKIEALKFKIKQHQPEICVYGGTTMMAAGTVAGVLATAKVPEVLDKYDDDIFRIKNGALTGDDQKKALAKNKLQYMSKIGLMYTPAAVLTVGGATTILAGFGIIKRRYAGVAAALATTTDAFVKYRERVVEEYGEEVDYRFKNGIKKTEEVVVNEDGTSTVVDRVTVETSQYAVMFDSNSTEWQPDYTYNFGYLTGLEAYMNTVLSGRGHLFLNEVYDQLGVPRTDAGAVCGWVYKGKGNDGYVDFGLSDYEKHKDFLTGLTPDVLLDFNVDGVIVDVFSK